MEYITIKQASEKWNVSVRRIRQYIKDGRISGSFKNGMIWNIPANTIKPYDKRFKEELPNFKIDIPKDFFKSIDEKKKLINKKRPVSKEMLESLKESNILEWTYNSNGIEGNTLTMKETKVVLEGITVGGKSLKEHLEVTNHREAILFLEDLVKSKSKLTEWDIKNIHQLVLKEIDNKNAGVYRKSAVIISGAIYKPSPAYKVPEEMEKLIRMYDNWNNLHPIIRAGLLHGEFVKIHPIIDGNGRTARLIMNFEVMKSGFPPIIIQKENRLKYYKALDKAHTTLNYTDFIKIIAKLEEEMLDKYLEVLGK